MALTNPAVNPPLLPSSTKPRILHSRSPSRSPVRHHPRDFDPLLRDLSPTGTLRAFSARPEDIPADDISKTLASMTHSERALGVKAAQTCLDVRSWARELETWRWPGTFDFPEPARKKMRMSDMSLESVQTPLTPTMSQMTDDEEEDEYWGSLPAETVRGYEQRVDDIRQQLDEVDVEELKDFVLSAHGQAGMGSASVDDSIGAIGAVTDLKRLDDFTAIVTATILQTLPYLSRLHGLLQTWSSRIFILTAAPPYLRDLKQARTDLDHGWAALAVSPKPASRANFKRDTMKEMRDMIMHRIRSLGKRLDRFLDDLEGREEIVPDSWITDFELLEEQYGDWVVQAERKVLEDEWRPLQEERPEVEIADTVSAVSAMSGSFIGNEMSRNNGRVSPIGEQTNFAVPMLSEIPRDNSNLPDWLDDQGSAMKENHRPSTTRNRHVPIVVDYTEFGRIATNYNSSNDNDDATGHENSSETLGSIVKTRTAFLNGDIEKSNSLIKSKSPPVVRPFEHASTAFTRLFKKEKTPERSRSNSLKSTKSDRSSSAIRNPSRGRTVLSTFGLEGVQAGVNASRSRTRTGSSVRGETKNEMTDNQRADKVPVTPRKQEMLNVTELTSSLQRSSTSSERPRTPERKVPETYKPTGLSLSSPFHSPVKDSQDDSPEFPADWPLSSPGTKGEIRMDTGTPSKRLATQRPSIKVYQVEGEEQLEKPSPSPSPEIHQPEEPLGSDVFDRMFVESLPMSGDKRSVTQKSTHIGDDLQDRTKQNSYVNNTPNEETADGQSSFDSDELVHGTPEPKALIQNPMPERQTPSKELGNSLPRPLTVVQEESPPRNSTSTSGSFSFDIHRRRRCAPFSANNSRHNSYSEPTHSPGRSRSTPPASRIHLKLKTSESSSDDNAPSPQEIVDGTRMALIRRASVTSIESFPRSELRAIDVPSSKRHSIGSGTNTPTRSRQVSINSRNEDEGESGRVSPLSFRGTVFPTPPATRDSLTSSPTSPLVPAADSPSFPRTRQRPSSPLADDGGASPLEPDVSYFGTVAPLNAAMSKRKNVHRPKGRTNVVPTQERRSTPLNPGEDNFDRHVSEVLDRVHAPIRFKSRPGAETPIGFRTAQESRAAYNAGGAPRPKNKVLLPKSGSNMTLAPAETSPRKSRSGPEEVKEYHLRAEGRDEPIKLFVRLVGEGERVMVRVGGGWADLADFLRQYAEHHGSRTVSDGAIEMHTVSANSATSAHGSSNGFVKRTFSTPAEHFKTKTSTVATSPLPPLPYGATPLERLKTQNSDRELLVHAQPHVSISEGSSPDDELPSPTSTPRLHTSPNSHAALRRTPQSIVSIKSASRPSTADAASRPSSRQQNWGEVSTPASLGGKGGPVSSGKKADLPEQKARWVEGMLERAKKASAEKSREEKERYFGEMGKVGGTRRVIFRSSSALGNSGGNNGDGTVGNGNGAGGK